ncbi:DUF4136 domain-containing protein [Pelagerythrobacter sp.]|uniref:DUF4136 domain-containing protein n=1 Tax=Pelagerythrobacter sp. TaxID=2800702 RepID=UPI0035AD9050
MKPAKFALATAALASLAACATPAVTGPVEVTRFLEPTASSQLGRGTIFVETAPGVDGDSLALAPYKDAIARELAALGYREGSRDAATQVAQVRVERYSSGPGGQRRGPVSVGVGGGTGSYGSGVGLGLGFNLGGGGPREMIDTMVGVMIRDKSTNATYWEGRAQFSVSDNSPYADTPANAAAVADALFRDFPGNNGETIEVRVPD